ncbi:Uncharacterised protein [Serratia odorifera]|uniref:Uncharacterized protein n=2 Tax=Serratia odorifera TaxID=618 RepID=D4E078_SEROD|nr:hypothetical protein [Serratia odorifera]EFE96719.1 hypothetical protein HMPREF0758_1578 [Serratia odorifera DSM 4582]MBJ2066370.1 hypothetical protein [Serratia odorifera]PNK91337.1 hypothetical protein CEQ31_017465 [Serratia odorifera]RII72575.1 hypothetical protein DX901_08965 [Serratia odorifera]VDZ56140.1 Uncharacterised protein [Serratia odorifera]
MGTILLRILGKLDDYLSPEVLLLALLAPLLLTGMATIAWYLLRLIASYGVRHAVRTGQLQPSVRHIIDSNRPPRVTVRPVNNVKAPAVAALARSAVLAISSPHGRKPIDGICQPLAVIRLR